MKKFKFALMATAFLALVLTFSSCQKEDDNEAETNRLIGTWKFQSTTNYYWYQLTFNEDLTGNRIDADDENDNFTYTFTDSEINFTSGFPNGKFNYSIPNSTQLIFASDTLDKQ